MSPTKGLRRLFSMMQINTASELGAIHFLTDYNASSDCLFAGGKLWK